MSTGSQFTRALFGAASIVSLLLVSLPVSAQTVDTVAITGESIGDGVGRSAVNAAAGVFNQQANVGVIVQGDGLAVGTNVLTQNLGYNEWGAAGDGPNPCLEESACAQTAVIGEGAFAGAAGAVQVNGAAGAENQQANLFSIGIGSAGRLLTLQALEQTRASKEPAGNLDVLPGQKTAEIDSTAFTGASGLHQVNLTAGERNSSANLFALTVTGGTD